MRHKNEHNLNFLEFLLKNSLSEEQLKEIIKNYSYFIYSTNKNYNYNSTYLESYCSKLYQVKNVVIDKNHIFEKLIRMLPRYLMIDQFEKFYITMDDFWEYDGCDIYHNGNIELLQLSNNNVHIECRCTLENIKYIYYDEFKFKEKRINKKIIDYIKGIQREIKNG